MMGGTHHLIVISHLPYLIDKATWLSDIRQKILNTFRVEDCLVCDIANEI